MLNLLDKNYINILRDQVHDFEFHNDKKGAYNLLISLKKTLKAQHDVFEGSILEKINYYITKLKYILFNTLPIEEILEMFKNNLVVGIKMTYVDLPEDLRSRISLLPIDDRDDFKRKLIDQLMNNNEIITKKALETPDGKIKPTVSAWIKDYNQFLGFGPKTNLEQTKYFFNNKNFTHTDKLEQLELKELFEIYEYLKRSSLTLEGNEDDLIIRDIYGRLFSLSNGVFQKLSPKKKKEIEKSEQKLDKHNKAGKNVENINLFSKSSQTNTAKQVDSISSIKKSNPVRLLRIDELKQMAAKYPEGSLERKAIEDEIKRIEREG